VLNDQPSLPMPLELARTLVVKGQVERRGKQKRAARASLERGLALCEQVGATLWAERARSELARVNITREHDELSPSEARVAELAAAGLSNREIAAAAFMSQKTVEANLSRTYRKLGIGSRAELGTRLAAAKQRAQLSQPASVSLPPRDRKRRISRRAAPSAARSRSTVQRSAASQQAQLPAS
jgi:DNA-binding CsgD family transcriptional regulator